MDIIRIILVITGILAALIIGYWLLGVIYTFFWLLVYAGIIGLIGYGGYKLFFAGEKAEKRLEEKTPVAIAEMKDAGRVLQEYKDKYLPK